MDPTKLSFSSAKIYLNLANEPERKKEFIEYVKKDKRLMWLGIAEGSWNAGLTFFVKSNKEFYELKNNLITKFKELILEVHAGILVDVSVCNKTFLCDEDNQWSLVFDDTELNILDEEGKQVLKELFLNSRSNIVDIARKIDSTVSVVRTRMKFLEEKKIVQRYSAKIDFNKLGYEFYKTFI